MEIITLDNTLTLFPQFPDYNKQAKLSLTNVLSTTKKHNESNVRINDQIYIVNKQRVNELCLYGISMSNKTQFNTNNQR